MKRFALVFLTLFATASLFAQSFPALDTLVATSPAPVNEISIASANDVDLVVWTSVQHLYGARVARSGELIDTTPLDLAPAAFHPSVASDGSRFVVIWSTGTSPSVTIDAKVIGASGQPGSTTTLVANANGVSRSRIAFGAGKFAFPWLDDTPFNEAAGTFPQGRISFLTIAGDDLAVRTSPFAVGAELGTWVDFAGTGTSYWTYLPPTILPKSRGVSALWYDATLRGPVGCGSVEGSCHDSFWDFALKHSELVDDGSGYVTTMTSPALYTIPSMDTYFALTQRPFSLLSANESSVLWTTDDYVPTRDRGDTIRRIVAADGELLQPDSGQVMFTSQIGSIRVLAAAVTERSFWIAWIDRMRDWEPPQPQRLFIEQVSATGEKSTYASLQGLASFAMASSANRLAIAAFVSDGWGGRIILETISEPEPSPSRTRALRR